MRSYTRLLMDKTRLSLIIARGCSTNEPADGAGCWWAKNAFRGVPGRIAEIVWRFNEVLRDRSGGPNNNGICVVNWYMLKNILFY